jgi:YcaO-like protein with predicted kinase domain
LETDRQHSVSSLRDGLLKIDKIVYRENGNRITSAAELLRRTEPLQAKLGITRIADISFLGPGAYPVFQSCRPHFYTHHSLGQNSGSQGKGATREQAMVSCLMETIESYCCEPRNTHLVRASYKFLKSHRAVADPRLFLQCLKTAKARPDEALLWTSAYWIEGDAEVLIPAECVYFPLLAKDYKCRSLYPQGSNGLASGASYLEAVVHGLYELIEREYYQCFESGVMTAKAIHSGDLKAMGISRLAKQFGYECRFHLYSLEHPDRKNLAVILCRLDNDKTAYWGTGCSANLKMSVDRAVSEAVQTFATHISGSREDTVLAKGRGPAMNPYDLLPVNEPATMRCRDLRKRVHDLDFASLNDEYKFLIRWLHKHDFPNIFVANLTRHGVDIPVVKIVIPNLERPSNFKHAVTSSSEDVIRAAFPNV